MRIHIIDMLHPPGIGMSCIADIELHQAIVSAVLAATNAAPIEKNMRFDVTTEAMRMEFILMPLTKIRNLASI